MRALLLILLAVILPDAVAQSSAQPPPPRFRTLGLGVDCSDLFYNLKDKDVPISVVEDTRSDFYELPAGDKVTFYKVTQGADTSVVRTPVADAVLTGGGRLPLLIFSASTGGSGSYKVEVLPDDLSSFPAGTYRVLNRTGIPLGCLLAGSPTVVPPDGSALLEKKPAEGMRTLFFQVYPVGGKSSQPLYSNNWAWNAALRTLVVAAPPVPPSTFPVIRRIVDSVEMLTAPAPKN